MATAPTPTQQIEELLECCVCLNTLTEPRTLPCFHSLCKVCLARYVETQRTDARREGRAQHLFNCPSCRTQFQLRQNDSVERLTSNFLINNLLDILKIQQEAEKVPCECCKSLIPAECRCIDCERYLCKNCLTTHSNWLDFNDHAVLTLQELAKPENIGKTKGKPRCKKPSHGNKVQEFYCNTCQTLACMNCVLLDHPKPDHDYQAIDVVAAQHKEALKATSAILQRKSNDGENAIKKIQAASQNLSATTKKAKDAILQQQKRILDEFTKKLDRNTAVLLNDVDEKHNDIKQKLSKQQKEMKEYVAKINGSLNMAKNIIEKGSNEEILSFQSEIEVNAKKIDKECPKMMGPMHNGDIYYHGKSVESVVENFDVTDLGNVIVYPVSKTAPSSKANQQGSPDLMQGGFLKANQKEVSVPEYWEPQPKDTNGKDAAVHLVTLNQNDAKHKKEYKTISDHFLQTAPQQKILQIQRVQNPSLFKQYLIRKQSMDDKSGSNEKFLFHGTGGQKLQEINEKGLNRSFAGSASGVAFGKGVYFARDASMSAGYAHAMPNGYRYMYYTKVAVGQYAVGNPSMVVPPQKGGSGSDSFDSTVNNITNPTIFVLFYDNQYYPEYLITFN